MRDTLRIREFSALGRVLYKFDKPFVVDASRSEREPGLSPTPTDEGIRRTVAWYTAQPGR
jgi:nucleoside-diphosphate-sugar epimerase